MNKYELNSVDSKICKILSPLLKIQDLSKGQITKYKENQDSLFFGFLALMLLNLGKYDIHILDINYIIKLK